jgi:hypothetical protein
MLHGPARDRGTLFAEFFDGEEEIMTCCARPHTGDTGSARRSRMMADRAHVRLGGRVDGNSDALGMHTDGRHQPRERSRDPVMGPSLTHHV